MWAVTTRFPLFNVPKYYNNKKQAVLIKPFVALSSALFHTLARLWSLPDISTGTRVTKDNKLGNSGTAKKLPNMRGSN